MISYLEEATAFKAFGIWVLFSNAERCSGWNWFLFLHNLIDMNVLCTKMIVFKLQIPILGSYEPGNPFCNNPSPSDIPNCNRVLQF